MWLIYRLSDFFPTAINCNLQVQNILCYFLALQLLFSHYHFVYYLIGEFENVRWKNVIK